MRPVTVKIAGVDSEAFNGVVVTVPEVQVRLTGTVATLLPGVEFSTGSLGHGLPFACGKALAAKRRGHAWRVLLSPGKSA